MSQLHCTSKRRSGQHITYEERRILEFVYDQNLKKAKKKRKTQKQLAKELGWSQATMSRELKRGRVTQLDTYLQEYVCYSAEVAQIRAQSKWENKGPNLKIGNDHELADQIEAMLLGEELEGIGRLRYSPEAIVMHFEINGWPTRTRLSAKTIYNYLNIDLFANVSIVDLPRKGKGSKRGYRRIEKRLRPPDCKRIEQRPIESEERSEPGHWEMDCIESVRGDKSCLLTMIDRQAKDVMIFKLPRQTQEAVLRRLNGLERKLGAKAFREKIKSITLDNGAEFLDWKRLEQSVIGPGKRTSIYYANAYSSWERGSVENLNGFIRYFIPKGTKIKEIKEKSLKKLEEFINNYPRKVLGGVSANIFTRQQSSITKYNVQDCVSV